MQGVDVGNLGIGIPGNINTPSVTDRWFLLLSEKYHQPMVPVFASPNKSAILVSVQQDQGAAAVNVALTFVRLKPGTEMGKY